jgi:dTMP kinase
VIDRYYYSGCVYSAAKHNPTLSLQWARKPDEGLPRPDVCVYLTISPDEAAKRGGFGEERYERQEMQERVRSLFGELQKAAEQDDFVEVDGGRALDDVEADVLKVVETCIAAVDKSKQPMKVVEPW